MTVVQARPTVDFVREKELLLSQGFFHRCDDRDRPLRIVLGLEAHDDLALSVDEELVKVPFDHTGKLGVGRIAREELEQGIDPLSLHDDLRKEES